MNSYLSFYLMTLSLVLAQENVLRLDLTPDEAQQFLSQHSLALDYAPKISENELPVGKNARGDFVYQGKVIDNPSDYVAEQYLAEQSHGQDGLGRYIFGYKSDSQGRVEAKNANGEIRGQYKFIDADGEDRVVNYWSDSLGFHHEDNRPNTILEPVTDEPAVRMARAEHLRMWEEAAKAAKLHPDPMSDYYNRFANQYDEQQAQLEQANEIVAAEENANFKPNRVDTKTYWEPKEELGIESQPRGFFYRFQYPVERARKIKDSSEFRKVNKRESTTMSVITSTSEKSEKNDENISESKFRVAEVHDVQVPRIGTFSARKKVENLKSLVKEDTKNRASGIHDNSNP